MEFLLPNLLFLKNSNLKTKPNQSTLLKLLLSQSKFLAGIILTSVQKNLLPFNNHHQIDGYIGANKILIKYL